MRELYTEKQMYLQGFFMGENHKINNNDNTVKPVLRGHLQDKEKEAL